MIKVTQNTTNTELKNALVTEWKKNNWQNVSVEIDGLDTVSITPCTQIDKAKSIQDIEDYLVYSNIDSYMGNESLDKVINSLLFDNYKKLIEDTNDEKTKLQKFFEKHIKGHSRDEITLGNEITTNAYDSWRPHLDEYKSFYDYLASKDFISEIAKKYQKSEDEINAAIKLSSDFGTYSDWHKDLYGYRPRNCFI